MRGAEGVLARYAIRFAAEHLLVRWTGIADYAVGAQERDHVGDIAHQCLEPVFAAAPVQFVRAFDPLQGERRLLAQYLQSFPDLLCQSRAHARRDHAPNLPPTRSGT